MVVVIALLLAAVPFVDAFWARDLGALARELVEDRSTGEERMLFEDLLALATCAPLPKLAQPSPLRELVRAEELRRAAHGTVWSDLLRKNFFRRQPANPDLRTGLRWPDEAERWPGETLLVAEPPWKCAGVKLGAGPLALLTPQLLRSLPPEPAARATYERAVLRYRQGALEGIAEVDPSLLSPELRPALAFLRLESGLDAPEGWIALARSWPGPAVIMRAAQQLAVTQRHAELVELTALSGTSLMHRHLLFLRALSLHALGRDREMVDALFTAFALKGPEEGLAPLRELAIAALARLPFDLKALARAGISPQPALEQLARRAMEAGNPETARAAAQVLIGEQDPRWRGQGLALAGELDWRSGADENPFTHLFEPAQKLGVYRDPAALQLAQAMVVRQAERREVAIARKLAVQLTMLADRVHLKAMPDVEALLTAARESVVERGEQPVALGEVNVPFLPAAPPAPRLELDLPEPFSLLAIPAPDGSLRAWFDRGDAL